MSVEKKEVEYTKEIDDCLVLIINLAKAIKSKKGPAEILSSELPDLINAMGGLNQLSDEAKNKKVAMETIGYRIGDLVDALIE